MTNPRHNLRDIFPSNGHRNNGQKLAYRSSNADADE